MIHSLVKGCQRYKWVFPKIGVPPFHTPKGSLLVGKPMVVGETHHFRKHPNGDKYRNQIGFIPLFPTYVSRSWGPGLTPFELNWSRLWWPHWTTNEMKPRAIWFLTILLLIICKYIITYLHVSISTSCSKYVVMYVYDCMPSTFSQFSALKRLFGPP